MSLNHNTQLTGSSQEAIDLIVPTSALVLPTVCSLPHFIHQTVSLQTLNVLMTQHLFLLEYSS